MAKITFTDAVGAATLQNNFYGTAAARFANWTPMSRPFGDSVSRQSDGAISFFKYRTDYMASFELTHVPIKSQTGAVNYVAIADRLIAWLLQGGQCAVFTEDTLSSAYATCGLAPGTTPSLKLVDRANLEYSLSLQLLNLAVSPVQMIAQYA